MCLFEPEKVYLHVTCLSDSVNSGKVIISILCSCKCVDLDEWNESKVNFNLSVNVKKCVILKPSNNSSSMPAQFYSPKTSFKL